MADLDPQAPAGDLDGHDAAPLLHQELAAAPRAAPRSDRPLLSPGPDPRTGRGATSLAGRHRAKPNGSGPRRLLRERLTRKGVTPLRRLPLGNLA